VRVPLDLVRGPNQCPTVYPLKSTIKINFYRTEFPFSGNPREKPKWYLPKNKREKTTVSWYTAWPRIFFIIVLEMSGFVLPYGFRKSKSGVGISVASAREANVSIIRFTHNIWTACSHRENNDATSDPIIEGGICPKRRTKRNWPLGTQQTASSASTVCISFMRRISNIYIKTNIDVKKQALTCLFYVFSVKFMLVKIKKQ